MDEMSAACFEPECELIGFGAEDWQETLAERQPHLLLVESCWQGNSGSWQYQVATYEHPDYAGLPNLKALVEWCREREIPTVFWNKEDPFHFDRFSEAAVLFDHVLTTDRNCIPRYQALDGQASEGRSRRCRLRRSPRFTTRLRPRMSAAIPRASPVPTTGTATSIGAGASRCSSMPLAPIDLVIYDRTFGTEDKAFGFPERFQLPRPQARSPMTR